ncbi:MAG: hypothetical protein ACJ8H8_28740 [Geminicoccaceae bacterium]
MHRTTALAAALLAGGTVAARAAPPEPNPIEASASGTLAHYTLAPRGEVDGFVLSDGTQVHFPPHLAAALVFTARPGDAVTVQGRRHKNGPVIEANEIRNKASGIVFVNSGPKHPKEEAKPGQVTGKVQFTLHGPKGDVNGAILEDGTVLRLPPREAATQLAPGQAVTAAGPVVATPMGKVVEVNKLDVKPGPS